MSRTPRRPGAQRFAQPALVLRRFPFGESSLVLHALTPELGRVALLAKGAYRPSSGFFAVFDLFDTLHVRWSARAGQELGLVTGAELVARRPEIAGDLARYRAALGLLELAHVSGRELHAEPELFRWLEGWLEALQRGAVEPHLLAVAADLGLLREHGLAPALSACASCGERQKEQRGRRAPFSAAAGGRLCARCAAAEAARGRTVEALPLNALRVAESLMGATPAMLSHTRIDPGLLDGVRRFVERFLEYHLETRLKSRRARAPSR